ncbi:MAG: hypothetical protein ACKO6N_05740 [Myxococcota bacterium]
MKMTSLFSESPRATAVQDLSSARQKSERLERHLRMGGVVMGIFSLVLAGGVMRLAPAYLTAVTLVLAGLCCMMAFALHHVHTLVQELLAMETRVRTQSPRHAQRAHLTEAGIYNSQPSLLPHATSADAHRQGQLVPSQGAQSRVSHPRASHPRVSQSREGLQQVRRCVSNQAVIGSASHAVMSLEDPHLTRIFLG